MNIAAKMTVPPRLFLGFCENIDDYTAALSGDCEVFGFTSGDFSLIDVIAALVRKMKSPNLVLSTWTAAKAEMDHVYKFLDEGGVQSAKWIVDRSFQNRQPDLCASLCQRFGEEAVRVQRVHCKFALLDDGERKVSIQTSANLNRNARIENVNVSSCPVFFEAYSDLVCDIFNAQLPGEGFNDPAAVTRSFKEVAQRKSKKKTISNPWIT